MGGRSQRRRALYEVENDLRSTERGPVKTERRLATEKGLRYARPGLLTFIVLVYDALSVLLCKCVADGGGGGGKSKREAKKERT